ncbi:MAG: Tm-1-like ATP-binding domain-containing protein [Verrucomicrobiales bacterium]|nr:Tm-1-like ATP-binding domain-containing protein [Verrucomicrobiales bacterium]
MATIAVLGTLDSKGMEHAYVADCIREHGHEAVLIDVGTGESPQIEPDITREQVAGVGGLDLEALMGRRDRGECVTAMSTAAPEILLRLQRDGRIDGVISLGGGGGTAIATAAMRALPIGFPKLMVSTLASGNTAHYIGTKDIVMCPSIVDVAGLNRISKMIFARAAGAICGMVGAQPTAEATEKPIIAASIFGNTTDCVNEAKRILEEAGYEVLVFHATGAGGRAMESLIESGLVDGVLDITSTEWADELVGGVLSAGPTRLEAAGKAGVPTIVVPGCVDMVNFGERDSVPPEFEGRLFYVHNPQVTLMRTSVDESRKIGEIIAEKLSAYKGPVSVLLPTKGVSVIGLEGQPFYDPEADAALFEAIRSGVPDGVPVIELDASINDPAFAKACAEALLEHVQSRDGAISR